MESKYLLFDKHIVANRKTPIYEIKNKNTQDSLGFIYFNPAWRKYVFQSNPDTIFDTSCLTDIIDFIQEIQAE